MYTCLAWLGTNKLKCNSVCIPLFKTSLKQLCISCHLKLHTTLWQSQHHLGSSFGSLFTKQVKTTATKNLLVISLPVSILIIFLSHYIVMKYVDRICSRNVKTSTNACRYTAAYRWISQYVEFIIKIAEKYILSCNQVPSRLTIFCSYIYKLHNNELLLFISYKHKWLAYLPLRIVHYEYLIMQISRTAWYFLCT